MLVLDLMMSFSSASVEKDIIRLSTSTTKRVATDLLLLKHFDVFCFDFSCGLQDFKF